MNTDNLPLERFLCSVLDEMREILKHPISDDTKVTLQSLVEESQVYANRMESALETYQAMIAPERWERLKEKKRELKKEIKELELKKTEKVIEDI